MVRRIASQVHQQVSRLLRANYLRKEPVWYQAVLDNPPITLPPKAPPPRTDYDKRATSDKKLNKYSTRPLPIYYIEDDIRRQFFIDHPFEAFRPTTLVEGDRIEDPHSMTGKSWTRLRQRGRNSHARRVRIVSLLCGDFLFIDLDLVQRYTLCSQLVPASLLVSE
jgi:small subunit ribosomal protein S23